MSPVGLGVRGLELPQHQAVVQGTRDHLYEHEKEHEHELKNMQNQKQMQLQEQKEPEYEQESCQSMSRKVANPIRDLFAIGAEVGGRDGVLVALELLEELRILVHPVTPV